jgi:hypothetical protein
VPQLDGDALWLGGALVAIGTLAYGPLRARARGAYATPSRARA